VSPALRADLAFLRAELDTLLDLLERVVFALEDVALGVLRRTLRHGHDH
jgi:hypothetical protein